MFSNPGNVYPESYIKYNQILIFSLPLCSVTVERESGLN